MQFWPCFECKFYSTRDTIIEYYYVVMLLILQNYMICMDSNNIYLLYKDSFQNKTVMGRKKIKPEQLSEKNNIKNSINKIFPSQIKILVTIK